MAASLIDSMTSDLDPDAHHDGIPEAMVEVVDAKDQGRELTPLARGNRCRPSTSLADRAEDSLAAASATSGAANGPKAQGDRGWGRQVRLPQRSRARRPAFQARAGKMVPTRPAGNQEEAAQGEAGGGRPGRADGRKSMVGPGQAHAQGQLTAPRYGVWGDPPVQPSCWLGG